MPSNCNFMVVTYCLVAIATAIVIDSTLGLIYCRKKVTTIHKHHTVVFIRKPLATFLSVLFYLLPDGKICKY